MSNRWQTVGCVLALVVLLTVGAVRADESDSVRLPPTVQRVLPWFPADTETVVAAQSFVLTIPPDDTAIFESRDSLQSFADAHVWSVLGPLAQLDGGKYVKPLTGQKVSLALRGCRNLEWVSGSLPAHRSESCTVVVFEKELEAGGEAWTRTLRDGGGQIRRVGGRDVFVFPPPRAIVPNRVNRWPGKLGVYIVLLGKDTIVCATSDTYLEEVLKRVATPPGRRALPDGLPEWKQIDPSAPVWMVRHVPEAKQLLRGSSEPPTAGLAWSMSKARFHLVFLPLAEDRINKADRPVEEWVHEQWKLLGAGAHPKIERSKEGVVTLTIEDQAFDSETVFGLAMQIYWTEAQ